MKDILPDGRVIDFDAPIPRERMPLVYTREFDRFFISPVPLANRHVSVTLLANGANPIVLANLKPVGATRVNVQTKWDVLYRLDGNLAQLAAQHGFIFKARETVWFLNEDIVNGILGVVTGGADVDVELYYY